MSPAERDDGPAEGALDRAATILGAFDPAHRELTLAALVARCGLPRSTTHRTAEKMIRLGWLDKPADRYRIGNRLFEIAGLAPIRLELREAVLPFLQDLHHATKITVQLGVLDGAQILVVDKISGHRAMPMLSQVGGVIPAYCSALGRAILAYSQPDVIAAVLSGTLPARTPRTLTSPVAVMRELTAIPERGWAVEREEGNIGVSCVAAPIFGPLGEVVAALSVTGPSPLVRADRLGPAVRLAASAASRAYTSRR
jgi:DNA-binding IclR family transcriptional regulator